MPAGKDNSLSYLGTALHFQTVLHQILQHQINSLLVIDIVEEFPTLYVARCLFLRLASQFLSDGFLVFPGIIQLLLFFFCQRVMQYTFSQPSCSPTQWYIVHEVFI